MTAVEQFTHKFVEYIPERLDDAVLYISLRYGTVIHLCACGCGNQVVSPLDPIEYEMAYDGEVISLWPSIGNWSFPCRSHYVVERGRVRWAPDMSDEEVAAARVLDRRRRAMVYGQPADGAVVSGVDRRPLTVSGATKRLRLGILAARRGLRGRRPR